MILSGKYSWNIINKVNMNIKFEKWHGLGNDFIILKEDIATPELAIKMCDRNFGVGADGLFCATSSDNADIAWKFFNSDGTFAQMCGNGIRCFAKYAKKHNLVSNNQFTVETLAGVITPTLLENENVLVDMGEAIIKESEIPVNVENYLDFKVEDFSASAISMGNPHCVIFTENDSKQLAIEYGSKIELSSLFPQKTNVEFVNIISNNRIKVNVWERGCGITLACGTGACASVVAGVKKGLINNICDVVLPGGILNIEYNQMTNHVFMSGPAEFVFEGEYLY